ncbi:MAG: protein translocase subunit SecF, partial [candidate division NC10 bacterium]|nr:protein translocase subunit SecF [candidate division NC10 bacterium]
MELIKKTSIDFIGKRRIAYLISTALVLLGLLAFLWIALGAANLGIEFVGGTSVQLKFEQPLPLSAVREALGRGGLKEAQPQLFAGGDQLLIRVKGSEVGPGGTADRIQAVLRGAFPDNPFTVEGSEEVGPAIGKDLRQAALIAIAVSLIGIIVYIAWRFDFKFGVAATIATFHDVLAVLGIVTFLGKEINLLIVTALLTIAGYSLTDTVVVYDRIRE